MMTKTLTIFRLAVAVAILKSIVALPAMPAVIERCTLSPATNEFMYAPSKCPEEWFGCPVQTWLAMNGVPFEAALWRLTEIKGGMVELRNEKKSGGFLTTLDGEYVVCSNNLGLHARSWIIRRVGRGQVLLENAKFIGKFLVTGPAGVSRNVFLGKIPQIWHIACRAEHR